MAHVVFVGRPAAPKKHFCPAGGQADACMARVWGGSDQEAFVFTPVGDRCEAESARARVERR